ncbi:methyl-CpG-binding domain protein 1a [Fundulus diaphanus]
MEKRREELSASGRKRRRQACGSCAACLRKNCARCAFCLDMRKFGGPCRLKQKCVMRRCLVVNAMKKWTREQNRIQAGEETDSTDAQPESNHWRGWRRWRHERDPAGGQEVKSRGLSGRWTPLWGEKHLKLMSDRGLLLNQEEQKKPGSGDTEVRKRRWMKRRRWGQTRAATDSKIRKEWDSLLMKEEEEEKPSQLPVSTGPSGPDGPSGPPGPPGPSGPSGPSGPLTGTHVQLNLTLDSGHLPSSILSDSALTCLSGLLPQEGSVLHVSTGLTFIPPPAAAVQSLQLKEEEEPVGIEQYGRGGGYEEQEEHEQEVWTGISEMGKYYEVEVELVGPDYNQRTLRAASPEPNDITEVPSTCDLTCERPEFLPLNPEGFGLLRSGVRNAVAGGRSLLRLLKMLRRTVLPAHWVAVLAAGPELQLLQCSRLSSMTDTIVHVQSDRSFYISIQTWPLPDSHRVYKEHAHRVAHLSQLVTLLLDLERLATCRGLRVQVPPGLQQVRSAGCHLLVARPFHTCLPCLLEEESEEDEESEDEDGTMSLDC